MIVLGAAAQLLNLPGQVQAAGGPGTSLAAMLNAVSGAVAAGNTAAACNQLGAFEHAVSAQSGKSIAASQAAALIAAAQQTQAVLGC